MNKNKIWMFLFIVASLMDILGIVLHITLLQVIFKPMIILTLIGLYFSSVEKRNYWYVLALAFSFIGDLLLLDSNDFFIYGIALFLVTQLLYIFIIVKQMERPSNFHKYLYAFLFANYVVFLLNLLRPNLGELFYPVLIYGITISIFGLVSTINYSTKRTKKSLLLMVGAILFIASDSMIALNKFYQPNIYYPVSIMVTYILAQFSIYKFMIGPSSDGK